MPYWDLILHLHNLTSKVKIFTCFVALIASEGYGLSATEVINSFKDGHNYFEFRLRYENVKQHNFEDAFALTLRSVLGFQTAKLCETSLTIEMTDVASFFGQNYNPIPGNFFNKSQYSIIPDTTGAGVTQAKLLYSGLKNGSLELGRQYIQLDNERFVGKSNWRQYPQAFDALTLKYNLLENYKLFYSYVFQVDTVFSNNRNVPYSRRTLNTQLIHLEFVGNPYTKFVGYVYLNQDRDLKTNSNSTYGIRLTDNTVKILNFNYALEYALQYGNLGNPIPYSAYYLHGKLSQTFKSFTAAVAFEILSGSPSDANKYLKTVYATKHLFNGYAGLFIVTPNQGLQDYFATLNYTYKISSFSAIFHYFLLDKSINSRRAGQELDLTLDVSFLKQLVMQIGFANYVRSTFDRPTTKDFWIMFTAHF